MMSWGESLCDKLNEKVISDFPADMYSNVWCHVIEMQVDLLFCISRISRISQISLHATHNFTSNSIKNDLCFTGLFGTSYILYALFLLRLKLN